MSQHEKGDVIVPLLCRFWEEDGVWNGIAEDAAVAVFGETFEEARRNLRDAIECHLEAAVENGELKSIVDRLRQP